MNTFKARKTMLPEYIYASSKWLWMALFFALSMCCINTVSASEIIRGDKSALRFASEPIRPIPLKIDKDPRVVKLGRRLFNDPRLSADNTVSCNSCHQLEDAGADGLEKSFGVAGAIGVINAPTIFNSGFGFVQFWDGRAASLEDQVRFPIHDPVEMASNWDQVISKLQVDKSYRTAFADIYPEGITATSISSAIATFERTLVTPNARFDKFLRGDENAINDDELKGYILFKSYGCSSCHQGVAVGGNMYEKMGVIKNYFKDRGNITEADYGRFNVTGVEEHRFEFKVPSLRNVALTSPYFHDGSTDTLKEAVSVMARYQLGRRIAPDDLDLIVGFLKTLTGVFER